MIDFPNFSLTEFFFMICNENVEVAGNETEMIDYISLLQLPTIVYLRIKMVLYRKYSNFCSQVYNCKLSNRIIYTTYL